MRAGRHRKSGARESNGRIRRIAAAERNAGAVEQITVLNQPHRRCNSGDLRDALDQKRESPLGRFVIRNKLRPELYDAGLEYGGLVRFYCGIKAVHVDIRDRPTGSGGDVAPRKARWLSDERMRLDRPLKQLNSVGFSAIRTLAVHEREIAPEAEPGAVIILCELGRLLKKTGR